MAFNKEIDSRLALISVAALVTACRKSNNPIYGKFVDEMRIASQRKSALNEPVMSKAIDDLLELLTSGCE